MYNREIEKTLERLRERVLKVTGVDVTTEKRRHQEIVYAKKIFCVVARQKRATFHQIGNFMRCNHATVIHHTKDFDYLCKFDPHVKTIYLRVMGMPLDEGRMERDFFDLTIGMI